MTNSEYEADSIAAAGCYERFEGEHKLKQWDEHISNLEADLEKAHEARREIVNFYNLNKPKCDHEWNFYSDHNYGACIKCGSAYEQSN